MRLLFLLTFLTCSCAHRYESYMTDSAYHINVKGYGLVAQIVSANYLLVRSPNFYRKWSLPNDANIKKATSLRKNGLLQITIPKKSFYTKIEGGEVPRGTVVKFEADHVCATFDNSEPICLLSGCKNGIQLRDFTIQADDVVLKMKNCHSQNSISQTFFYHSFDTDIFVEDEDFSWPENQKGKHGWFDRHGKERDY